MAKEIFSAWFFQLALVAAPVVVLGYPVLLWMHLVKKRPHLPPVARRALSLALAALPVAGVLIARSMLSNRSSTSAIGLVVVPLLATLSAAVVFAVAWAIGYLFQALPSRERTAKRTVSRLQLLLALLVVAGAAWPATEALRREWLLRQIKSPQTSVEDLRQLFEQPVVQDDPWLLAQLAARSDAPPDLLLALSRDPRAELGRVRQPWLRGLLSPAAEPHSAWGAVARNPQAPEAALRELAGRPEAEVGEGVASNPRTPAAVLRSLLASPHPGVLAALALHPRATPDMLDALADRSEVAVRAKVAANPKTPSDTLAKLGSDPDQWVRLAVASNPSAAPATLLLLARDPVAEVRGFVATNPRTPAAAVELLTEDPDERVRRYATQRPDASHDR